MGVILIAFERETEQSTLEQMLAGKGHRIVRSGNGLAALDAARREPPDLIVSDIVLPRMDGFALCRKWKQDERLQSIPFVFYTRRHNDPKYERFALELGAERFLARSVPPEALLTAVSELLADAPARKQATAPLPALDEAALKREAMRLAQAESRAQKQAVQQLEQAQAQARTQIETLTRQLEQAQSAQGKLRTEVDELKAVQERLTAGEARFRRAFDANPLPMWMVDRVTAGFVAVNEATLQLFGYTRPEFLGLKSEALLLAGVAPQGGVQMHQRKDGAALALAVVSREIEFDGRAAELVCAFDLSERVAAERQLQSEASGSRAVLDAAADGCLVLDAEGKIREVNAAYCRMLGYGRDALLGKNAAELEDQSVGETTMRLQVGRVRGGARYETKHRRADGSLLEVEVSVGLLEDARGGSVVLVRDVGQRRREFIAQRTLQRQSDVLLELFRAAETLDESALVRRFIEQAAESLRSPLSYLFFVQSADKTIALAAWRDSSGRIVMAEGAGLPLAQASLFTECVRARQPTSSNDPTPKPQADGLPDLQRYLAAPLVVDGEVAAVLGVANRDANYGEEDQRLLTSLAENAQRVLHIKRSHANTLRALQRTDVALQSLIDSFVRVSERHDPYTAGSARRLAALAVALGREAGLDGERQHGLRMAAMLHDVGNIAVPASILAKPAPLTETELAVMRTHVEEGCQLLAEVDFGAPVADIVYQSHERFDGSGYPRGLKGEEILLEARILGIADTVEAMCSPRPYRPAAGMDAAIEELNRGAGRLYDPHLVAACTRLVRQHGFTLPE